jgi:hypothetical protein
MATTCRKTKYCPNHSSFKIVQQPFTPTINTPTIMATILEITCSHIYLLFHKTGAETVCSYFQSIKATLQVRNTAS